MPGLYMVIKQIDRKTVQTYDCNLIRLIHANSPVLLLFGKYARCEIKHTNVRLLYLRLPPRQPIIYNLLQSVNWSTFFLAIK
jgi:hypothetical protein